jgi:predicted deacylase
VPDCKPSIDSKPASPETVGYTEHVAVSGGRKIEYAVAKSDTGAQRTSIDIHGDELNGIEVVREVVDEWDHDDIHGCVVGLPVLNVPGFITQERYLPIYERDLNRAFPGKEASTSAYRIAHRIYTNFIAPCDFGIDFHTLPADRRDYYDEVAVLETERRAALRDQLRQLGRRCWRRLAAWTTWLALVLVSLVTGLVIWL